MLAQTEMSKVLLEMPTTDATSLSLTVGGGLFAGGFATAILIIVVPVIIAYVYQHLYSGILQGIYAGGEIGA